MFKRAISSPERSLPNSSSSERELRNTSDNTTRESSRTSKDRIKVKSRDFTNLTELGKRGLMDRWRLL